MATRFDVLPIRLIDGDWNVPDDAFASLWRRMVTESKVEPLFYSGGIGSAADFMDYLKRPDVLSCLVIDTTTRQPAALAWLTNIGQGAAFPHYCVFGRPRRSVGGAILEHWKSLCDPCGAPLIEVLIGVTPETHALALRVMKIMGFTPIGVIPRYCVCAFEGGRRGAVISHHVFERNGASASEAALPRSLGQAGPTDSRVLRPGKPEWAP